MSNVILAAAWPVTMGATDKVLLIALAVAARDPDASERLHLRQRYRPDGSGYRLVADDPASVPSPGAVLGTSQHEGDRRDA